MQLNRRQLLLGSGALVLAGCLPSQSSLSENTWLVSAAADTEGNHFAVAVDMSGKLVSKIALPERGHDVLPLPHKPGHAIVVARRPDRYLLEVDFRTGSVVQQTQSQPDTHFYGHARISTDGKYLITSENQFDKGTGVIALRDLQNLQVIERFGSGGIGPHDMGILPDGKTLVVANGGIITHPDYHRIKLNLNEMTPNLSYLDLRTGKVLESYMPEHHQQSIRHLNVREDGKVFVGIQYQGDKSDTVPLVYGHHGEEKLQAFTASQAQWRSMNQYTASVLVQGDRLAISCPRGGSLTIWNANTHEFEQSIAMEDVSGLCSFQGELMASTGHGDIYKKPIGSHKSLSIPGIRFDNHMALLTV
jgi:hypothetical protein